MVVLLIVLVALVSLANSVEMRDHDHRLHKVSASLRRALVASSGYRNAGARRLLEDESDESDDPCDLDENCEPHRVGRPRSGFRNRFVGEDEPNRVQVVADRPRQVVVDRYGFAGEDPIDHDGDFYPNGPVAVLCEGDHTTWESQWGFCNSYVSGTVNNQYCGQDTGLDGLFANAVCPECGICVATVGMADFAGSSSFNDWLTRSVGPNFNFADFGDNEHPLPEEVSSNTDWILLRSDVECGNQENEENLGTFDSVDACAEACRNRVGCTNFIYGKEEKAGRCWDEGITESACTTWEDDQYDFYGLLEAASGN